MKGIIMIACMLLVQTVYAQIEKRSTELDKAIWECRYECVQKIDTLGTQELVDTMYLRIGNKVSQFYSYSAFYADSLANEPKGSVGQKLLQKQMTEGIMKGTGMPGAKILGLGEYYYKNYPDGVLSIYAFRQKTYLMEEEYAPQEWTMINESKIISGYACKKAICHFRGRDYVAWYSTDINCSEGPWKFHGLPGLILEVYDMEQHYRFTLIDVNTHPQNPVYLYMSDKALEKMERKEYLKDRAVNYTNNKERAVKRGKSVPAYDLLERDYK